MNLLSQQLLKNLTMLFTDAQFWYPAYDAFQQQLALAVSPQYFYVFKYRGSFSTITIPGGSAADHSVAHADDLLYLFPSGSYFSDSNTTMSKMDYEVVDIMVKLWTSFAIDG